MKRIALLAAGIVAYSSAIAQVAPSFQHVARVDLTSLIFTGSAYGEVPTDVETDGTNVFVAAMKSSAGTGTAGIVKIASPLNGPVASGHYTRANVAGGGADARLAYVAPDSRMLFGFGFTAADNTGGTTGVVALDPNGTAFASFSGDGVLTPSEAQAILGGTSSNRIDALAFDNVGANRVNLAFRNRGSLGRVNPLLGSMTGGVSVSGSGNFVAVRAMAFEPTAVGGAMYFRANNDVLFGNRTGNNVVTPVTLLDLAGEANGGAAQQSISVRTGDGTFLTTLAFNDRSAQTANNDAIRIGTVSSGTLSLTAPISGAEPINGVAQQAFTSSIASVRFAKFNGEDYLLVTGIAGASSRPVLSIYKLIVAPAETTVSGTLDLNGWGGGARDFTVTITTSGGTETKTVSVNGDGTYSFSTALSGAATIKFARRSYNAKQVSATIGTNPVNATLLAGDVDDDDTVSILDYIFLSTNYEKDSSASDWNTPDPGSNNAAPADTDFDGDGTISILDYITLSTNYETAGDGKP